MKWSSDVPAATRPVKALRQFSSTHIGEDCRTLKGRYENALFHNCQFEDLNDLELINCVLRESTFITTDPAQALRLTLTLNCNSFHRVKLSPELFDLLALMLCKTEGNDDKRQAIVDHVIGRKQARQIFFQLSDLE
jgi:hypothetical protein